MTEYMNSEQQRHVEQGTNSSSGKGKVIFILILIIFAVVVIYFFVSKSGKNTEESMAPGNITINHDIVDSSKYQAVFLTNGQTYFGKIENVQSQYVQISDVYYIVLQQPLQSQTNDEGGDGEAVEQKAPEYTLVKLGKELHGPTSMSINRDHILFVEDLSDDSKIVKAIKGSNQ